MIHDTQVYGLGLAEEVQKELELRGLPKALFETVEVGQVEFTDLVAKLREAGTVAVYFAGYPEEAGVMIRQAWDAGLKIPLVGGDGIGQESYWMIAGPDAAKATVMTSVPDFAARPEAAAIVSRFKTLGYDLGPLAFPDYASVQVWAQAVEKAKSTSGSDVAKVLRSDRFDTVVGRIGFDAKGDLIGSATWAWWTWKDGTTVPVSNP